MCFLAFCRNKRERDREVFFFLKEGKREWERDWTKIFKNRD